MINIRYATAADSRLLAEVGAETFFDSFAADNTPENMAAYLAAAFSPQKQRAELAAPNSRFFMAEVAGETAGFAQLKFGATPAEVAGRQPVEIARLYARKAWIGRGIGAALMARCLAEARAAGCDVIWLGVWERNPRAIEFYTKWGFAEVGAHIFQVGDDPQRDLLLARPVELR
ncbi:MAG: GNAT family N-acetyltransferase [Anaerolineae bacterium]